MTRTFAQLEALFAKAGQKASVYVSCHLAELVLPVWLRKYPYDNRPADAIAAARLWLQHPTAANSVNAVDSASSAYSAASEASSAYSAAYAASAAYSAARAAYSAASAAYSASDGASAANSASYAASAANSADPSVDIDATIDKSLAAYARTLCKPVPTRYV
jgi:hypothetical protein